MRKPLPYKKAFCYALAILITPKIHLLLFIEPIIPFKISHYFQLKTYYVFTQYKDDVVSNQIVWLEAVNCICMFVVHAECVM